MARHREFMLPDHTVTRDAKKYIRAWRRFAKPLCKVFDARLYAFDPGISLQIDYKTAGFWKTVQFERHVVERLNKALANAPHRPQ